MKLAVGALLVLAGGAPASPAPDAFLLGLTPTLSAEERSRLEAGETIARTIPMAGENQRAGLAVRMIDRDPERVFRAISDVDHWREWVPFLVGSGRARAPGPASRELRFDLPWPLRNRHYRAIVRSERSSPDVLERTDEGGRELAGREWTLSWVSIPDSGNVEWARGSFRVRRQGGGRTLVVFRSATDLGELGFSRALVDRILEKSLLWVLDALAQQVDRCRYTLPYPDGCEEERPSRP